MTAVACLLGQGSAFAHLVLVQHATCVQHDALVHADSGGADAAASGRQDDRRRLTVRPGPVAAGFPAEAGHDDDHCLVASFRRREALAPAPTGVTLAVLAAGGGAAPAARAERQLPVVPLLMVAPKSSPPSPFSLA